MSEDKKKMTYFEKISLNNKSPEEAERITKLFNDNINLANRLASKYYKTQYWEFDEAVQIARLGLWKACLIWDEGKYRLSTLAYNIMNRDFMDYDRLQKKQPEVLFNIEENCVTDDLCLGDVLLDEKSNIEEQHSEMDALYELNEKILYVLQDIATEYEIPEYVVKLIYLVYIESVQESKFNFKQISFIPRQNIKLVINELQVRLKEEEYNG